jgi:hypothetical protein
MAAALLFHFLPGLPEEQVGADRGAQQGHQPHRMVAVEPEGGHGHAAQHRDPVHRRHASTAI